MGPDDERGGTVAVLGDARVTLTEAHDERGCHLALAGRLDVRTVADVRSTLNRSIAAGSTAVHLDLGEAHVGDATGFGLLVEVLRRARRAGRPLVVVAADDRTRRLFRRARMGSLLADDLLAGAVG